MFLCMEFENYDIIQLHHLLDKYVYSQVNYENELNRKTIKTNISWKEILPFLHCPSLIEAKKQMREAFYCYAQTFVTIYTENDFFSSYPLVVDVDATDFGIMIEHNTIALKHYLKHFDKKVEIWNRFIENLLTLHLKSPGRVIYSYLCRGYENTISMEILKKDLGSTLSNPQFLYRIIRPIEAEILSLYNKRLIPFYVKVETQKSASGSGGRLLGVTFNFIDEVSLIRQTKLLPEYLEYLEEQLLCIYPMEYPFLMEQIKEMPTAIIEKLHNTIKYIGADPVAYELPIARVVKTKLEEDFNIKFS
ncbi:hypothetical protein DXC34_14095 [Bacteroides stercoris]|uniref:Uncharacterized protein n=2 Tax=Bacteroides stercoris TaxID=46506 RepID=A0A3E4UL32_BACSE|nr:hypothetical protein DXC34_14095 [Bacteroides stercoris]